MKKNNIDSINELKEAFQNESNTDDINSIFFDLSANYFKLLESEKAPVPDAIPDKVILDIGGAYGEYDDSRIPWDSENKELLPAEALYGIVPAQASSALFSKINEANQLSDISSLPFDEDSKQILYQSPSFDEDPANEAEDSISYQVGEQMTNLIAPMIISELIETTFEEGLGKGLKGAISAPLHMIGMAAKPILLLLNFISGGLIQKAAAKGLHFLKAEAKAVNPGRIGKIVNKLSFAVTKLKKLGKSLEKVATKFGEKVSEKILKVLMKIMGEIAGKLIMKAIIKSIIASVSLTAINPVVGTIYDVIVMPLVLILSLSGVVDGAIMKSADPEGCCPPNSVPLDEIIPEEVNNLIVGNIPVIGDILGFFYPYVCSENGTGNLVYKLTLILPKYIEYPWLSSYYLRWPDYNCRIHGRSPVYGKKYTNGTYDWNNSGIGYYTDMNRIIANHEEFRQVMRKKLNGKTDESEIQYIVQPGHKFFYADFTEPRMLIDMAQFYYKWAINDPYPNDDGSVTVEYISKINYVAASSLYTCDVNCEMVAITYDPLSGNNYSETITYDRDRRFYYRVNNASNAPQFWEDSSDSTWRTKDDAYDLAVYDLNAYIHQDRFNNSKLEASVLMTAYRQMLDASERLTFISNIAMSNYANKPSTVGTFDNIVQDFYRGYTTAQQNLSNLPRTYLNGFNTNDNTFISNSLSTIVGCSNDLWNYHKNSSGSQIETYRNNQYKLYGCTKLDSTASCAATPDVINLEDDTRFFTNFNVLPYIKRCESVNMNITKCMDPSNVELIIYNYYLQNPNKRIKSINNIKAKGRNACEFTWDEVTYNNSTKAETDFRKNVNTTILYQQDLSSCTFCLPPSTSNSGSNKYLYGTQSNASNSISSAAESIRMFKNPVDLSDVNYDGNSILTYTKAPFKIPVMPTDAEKASLPVNKQNRPKSFIDSNVDYVPRYDPTTFDRLPDLIRPKKPIRIHYPNEDQQFLGNQSNNFCSEPATLSNFILSYNGNSNNINKIAKVIRTFTSSSNTCDMEVDIYIKNSKQLQRQTMTMNMKEGFNNPFTYDSLNTEASGLNINSQTDSLSNPYQNGFGYTDPYLRSFKQEIGPNAAYFNDNLIKDFTDKTKGLRNSTYRMVQGLVGTQHLGDSNCNTKCNEDEIVQRIIEDYNKNGSPTTRFDTERNSVIQVLNSATNSSNTCHVLLENKKEYYGDYYTDQTNLKSSSNYITENRLVFKEVQMRDAGNCTFVPVVGQTYQDISASDLALTSSSNFNKYKTPLRTNCIPVNCRDANLYNAAFNNYKESTGNTVNTLLQSMNVTNNICDYLIESQINVEDEMLDADNYVLRVNYDNTHYTNGMNSNCSQNNTYSYTSDNFVLQTPVDLTDYVGSNNTYYEYQDPEGSNASPLLTYDESSTEPIRTKINSTRVNFS